MIAASTLRTEQDRSLVADFFRYFLTRDSAYFNAFIEITDLASKDPERLWILVGELLELNSEETFVAYIGEGPMEDLLTAH